MENKVRIILIAAIGKNRELGKGSDLIWKLSGDLKRFKEVTKGHPVIMGKKTFDSIGHPLPKRINIVVTRDKNFRHDGCVVVHSVGRALYTAKNLGEEKIYVIGGGEIYRQTLPYADQLDLTLIESEERDADIFFPEFEHAFKKISESDLQEENDVSYRWAIFEKN